MVPQVSKNIQLGAGRPVAADCSVSERGCRMEQVAWEKWEQGEGEHDAKQEGSGRNRKKACDLGPRERGAVWGARGLEMVIGHTCAKPCRCIKKVGIFPKRNEKPLKGFKQVINKIISAF